MINEKSHLTADMHTHSESSHDSQCPISDMYNSQLKKGTEIFAVTDHFDAESYNDYDIFTPILKSKENIERLCEQTQTDNILFGIEMSECFRFPKVYEKVSSMTQYDVIIGSVHLVRYPQMTQAYSKIDFSKCDDLTVRKYFDAYLDDMLSMLADTDFDILAHLTCPFRYINGKYSRTLSISYFEDKINEILNQIIKKNIALEVNTSSFDVLNDFMPPHNILQKYHDMGGELLTLGSDAHVAQNASVNFDKALEKVKSIGFDGIYFYKKRKPHKIILN